MVDNFLPDLGTFKFRDPTVHGSVDVRGIFTVLKSYVLTMPSLLISWRKWRTETDTYARIASVFTVSRICSLLHVTESHETSIEVILHAFIIRKFM